MDTPAIEVWLKTTVPGIILLGAAGSILAVVVWSILGRLLKRFLPNPYELHKGRKHRQAYMLGFAAAIMEGDTTGRSTVAYLVFHSVLFMMAGFLVSTSTLIFMAVISFQPSIALTWGTFLTAFTGFIGIYWAYFEFEYVYRTYRFYWGDSIKRASEGYTKKYRNEKSDVSPPVSPKNTGSNVGKRVYPPDKS